jgi:hypothetical protein
MEKEEQKLRLIAWACYIIASAIIIFNICYALR